MVFPDDAHCLVSEPSSVVLKIIVGVKRNKLHVFPDKHARRIYYLTRSVLWLMPILSRRVQAESIEAGK